jgi:hypothetical protein
MPATVRSMPIASIDLLCTEGVARASFRPPVTCELIIAAREQFAGFGFEELRTSLQAAAVAWQVSVDVELLPKSR